MIRTFFWWLVFIPSTVLFSLLTMAARVFDGSGNTSHNLNRVWGRVAVRAAGCRVEIRGMDNLLKQGQIIVSNHQSGFDIYALTAYIPVQIRWIAKKSLFRIPVMGWGMKASGYISLDRDNPRNALRSLRLAAENIRQGRSAVIFPEGTRTPDGALKEFKKGLFRIAKKARCPLTPVTIDGTFNIMKKKSLRVNPQAVRITIDPPIPFSQVRELGEERVLDKIRGLMLGNLNG